MRGEISVTTGRRLLQVLLLLLRLLLLLVLRADDVSG